MPSVSKNDLTVFFIMSALFLNSFLQIHCVLPWKIIERMGTLISFQIKDGMFLVFLIKYITRYRFVIFSLLRFVFPIPSFLKAFYQEGIFNFLRVFYVSMRWSCDSSHWFVFHGPTLYPWNKQNLVMAYYFITVFFNVNSYPCCFVWRQFIYIDRVLVAL